jgi:hypothetical protein
VKLDWVLNETARMRGQIRAQEREIGMLKRAWHPDCVCRAAARMRASVDDLGREPDALRR